MPTPGSIKITDYSDEDSFFQPNIDAALTPAAAIAALEAIITPAFNDAIILGLPTTESVAFKGQSALAGPVSNLAQRELKWAVTYKDTSEFLDDPTNTVPNPYFGKLFTSELPTANPALLSAGRDTLDLADVAVSPFVTAFEANAVSPVGGNVEVQQIRIVGRNI